MNRSDTVARILKVFGYLFTSTLVAVLLSPELRQWIEQNPEVAALAPVINIALAALAREIQKRLPEGSVLQRAL